MCSMPNRQQFFNKALGTLVSRVINGQQWLPEMAAELAGPASTGGGSSSGS
jgi:hypothetical protein